LRSSRDAALRLRLEHKACGHCPQAAALGIRYFDDVIAAARDWQLPERYVSSLRDSGVVIGSPVMMER
jgi:hypothetical protein